jgi:hypothetical protein
MVNSSCQLQLRPLKTFFVLTVEHSANRGTCSVCQIILKNELKNIPF